MRLPIAGRCGALLCVAWLFAIGSARAEDGYKLWLRYARVDARLLESYAPTVRALVARDESPAERVVADELARGLAQLLGREVERSPTAATDGAIVAGTPAAIAGGARRSGGPRRSCLRLGDEGYVIRSASVDGRTTTVIASAGEAGVLYGTFHLLRLMQTGDRSRPLDIAERPRLKRRLLNHWDNIDGTIERGYAGRSLWDWTQLPATVDPRITDYARANASLGINGTVINSVNANPRSCSPSTSTRSRRIAGCCGRTASASTSSANFAAPRDDRRTRRPPIRSTRRWPLVARQGRRDLRAHPRLRRLRGQGQQRGPARPAGLQAHARRRRQHAGRRRRAARRHRHVARVRLQRLASTPIASSARTPSSRRSTARSATTSSSRSRTARSTSSRASPSIRCSAPCRRRR